MKATEQYLPVFIMLYIAVLAFDSVYEILSCDHSNEGASAVLPCGNVYFSQFYQMKVLEFFSHFYFSTVFGM